VRARVEAAGLRDDGVVQIECTLRDGNGERARNDVLVSVEVEGGELLGIESGDLADNTPYTEPHRKTFDGRVIVFVRADGPAQVRLSADGLAEVEVECGS